MAHAQGDAISNAVANTKALAAGGIPGAAVQAVASSAHTTAVSVSLDILQFIAAFGVNLVLYMAKYMVTITGALLAISINLTLNIRGFVDKTEGVYLVWTTIRDISGLFIIFMLLYASFMMILDQPSKATGSVANLIKNIVIAGILINFSFFIVSVLIDASNIVSLALYKGIVGAPPASQSLNIGAMTKSFVDGNDVNLGNVFLNHLAPQAFYNIKLGDQQSSTPDFLKTIVQGVVGTVVMFTISMSFLLASAAFVVRLVLLIILLAFSPVWFAAMIFPALKEKSEHFTATLKAQLIFMPVYLLLLYGSIEILTKSTIFVASGYQPSVGTGVNGWLMGYVTLAVNDFFVIFLLNIPLVVAFSFASKGLGAGWMQGAVNRFGAENIWRNVGGWAGRNTIGHIAYNADEALAKTRLGNMSLGRDLRFATTGALAKAKMGGDRNYEDVRTIHADVVRRAAAIDRLKKLKGLIARGVTNPAEYNAVMKDMSPKEKLELSPDIWTNKQFLKQIDDSDYKAYRKSERVEDTDVIKEKVKGARRDALQEAVAGGEHGVIKHMLEEMDGHELIKQVGRTGKPGVDVVKDSDFIEHLTPAHLKAMEEEGLDAAIRTEIGRKIDDWHRVPGHTGFHKSRGFINKPENRDSWH